MDLPSMLQAVEAACRDFQNPATRAQAERTLIEFRNSPHAFAASQYILQHSGDLQAQFQAVLALRHAALSGWACLPVESKQGLLQFLLQYAMHQSAVPQQGLVQAQCAATLAALCKRGWEDMAPDERHALMQGIDAAATQAGTPHARRASLQLLTALVQEFSPATASPLGLPWDQHERCRASLEATYLQGLFVHALGTARESAAAAAAGVDEAGVCLASLGLLCATLGWDFSRAGGSAVWRRVDDNSRPNEAAHVRPPPSWAELLLAPGAFDWLEGLLQACRDHHKSTSPLARGARQLLCQLCALSGDIFPAQPGAEAGAGVPAARAELGLRPETPAGPEGAKDLHLLRVLRMLLPLVAPPAAAVHAAAADDESQLLDACRGLLAAAAVHRAPGFERAAAGLGELPHPGGVLGLLSELTQGVLGAGGADPESAGWAAEAADMLLEAWVELLADPCRGPVGSSPAAVAAAGAVFSAVMEAALRDAAAGAHEDAEDEQGGEGAVTEEWLDRVAAVGRAAAALALPALAQRMQQCQGELAGCLQAGRDPSAVLEQLCWVVSMAAHVLADAGEGETPLAPQAIVEACSPPAWAAQEGAGAGGGAGGDTGGDPVVALSRCLLGVGSMCLEEAVRPVISPRLMEVVVASLGRWADTYLMPEEQVSQALDIAFGAGPLGPPGQQPQQAGGGPAVLESLVQLLLAALTRFPGETTLHEIACQRLLGPLARRWLVCQSLMRSQAWTSLVQAVGEGAPGVCQLAAKVQRRLLQGVCLAAEGLRAEDSDPATAQAAAEQYISGVLRYTVAQLQALGSGQSREALQRADTMQRAAGLLESMRGAARGVLPHTQAAIVAQFTAVSQPLLTLLNVYAHHASLVALVLKLAAELADSVVGGLSAAQAGALFAWALELLRIYAARNLGQVSLQAAALRAERDAERYKDLRALLRLLTNLSHRDWSEASALAPAEARQGAGDDVAQVVFAGLDIILPLVSPDLLKFPKLARQYFTLLAYMMEVYPERVAALPPPLFRSLAATLRFGIGVSGDPEVTQAVFEALAALAKYHAVEAAGGRPGLGANNTAAAEADPGAGATVLGGLLGATLQRLLQDDAGAEAADAAAEALLPLLLTEMPAMQAAGEALIATLPDQRAKDKVTAAFLELTSGIERSLDRGNRQRFRANLLRFAGEVRGAVRVR